MRLDHDAAGLRGLRAWATTRLIELAVAVTACLLIGLPLAAWLFSRRLEASRPHVAGGFGPPAGAADRWLIERYELSALRRYAVRQAVTSGRALDDPVERAAACDLAAAVLNGQIKVGTGIRLGLRVQLAEATVLIGAGAFIMAWGRSPAGIAPGLLGGWYAIRGVRGMRMVHGSAERALWRNQQPAAAD